MGIVKLRLAVPILAPVSTGAAAAELVNPLKVLEDSRRAGVEFDKRRARHGRAAAQGAGAGGAAQEGRTGGAAQEGPSGHRHFERSRQG